jgi:hypothetical protein
VAADCVWIVGLLPNRAQRKLTDSYVCCESSRGTDSWAKLASLFDLGVGVLKARVVSSRKRLVNVC